MRKCHAALHRAHNVLVPCVIIAAGGGVIVASLAGPALVFAGAFIDDGCLTLTTCRQVFASWNRWQALLANTGTAAAAAVIVSCTAGILIAGLLFKTDIRGRLLGIGLVLLAGAVPLYVVKGAMVAMVGLEPLKGSAVVVGLIHAVAHLPIVVIVIGIALRSVPAAAEESALVHGAGAMQTFVRITLRTAIGGVVTSGIITLLWVTTDYSVSDILMVRTFAEEVYTLYALHGRPQEPALVCLPQMILFGGLLWTLRNGYLTGADTPVTVRTNHKFGTGGSRRPLSLATVAIPLALVAAPVIAVLGPLWRASDSLEIASWFVEEVSISLVTGTAAGIISAGLGLGLAWYIVRRPRWRPILAAYVVFMLSTPAPIHGMGMIQLFNRPGPLGWLYDSPAILTLAYVFRFLPIAVILLIPAVRAVPIEHELAARVDGCTGFGVWRRIVWPQCRHMALVAVFIVTVLAVGELPCSLLITPPGYITVGARFFSLVHYGMYPDAAMLCLLSIASVMLPCGAILLLMWRQLAD